MTMPSQGATFLYPLEYGRRFELSSEKKRVKKKEEFPEDGEMEFLAISMIPILQRSG
jgi:hypothetical protein